MNALRLYNEQGYKQMLEYKSEESEMEEPLNMAALVLYTQSLIPAFNFFIDPAASKNCCTIPLTYMDIAMQRIVNLDSQLSKEEVLPRVSFRSLTHENVILSVEDSFALISEDLLANTNSRRELTSISNASNYRFQTTRVIENNSDEIFLPRSYNCIKQSTSLFKKQQDYINLLYRNASSIAFDSDPSLFALHQLPVLKPDSFEPWFPIPSAQELKLFIQRTAKQKREEIDTKEKRLELQLELNQIEPDVPTIVYADEK